MKIRVLKQIKYFFGTIYRGLIGIYHNTFDQVPEIDSAVEWFVIGKSIEGKIIKCYKVTSNKVMNSKVVIVGGIHGNEVGTVKLASKIVNHFWRIRDKLNVELFVIPCLNPDGYYQALNDPDYWHRGKVGRFNANNVDLNRNFPTRDFKQRSVWQYGKDYSQSREVYCGKYGGSEPETKSLIEFIQNQNIENLIMLHNIGKDVIINENDEVAKKWAGIYYKYAKFNIKYSLGFSGSAARWALENSIHYMTVEGSSRWGSDWNRQRKAIVKVLKEISK